MSGAVSLYLLEATAKQGAVVLDTFTVSLHSLSGRYLPAVGALQGGWQWPQKDGGKSHPSREPTIHYDWSKSNLYLDQPITKRWYQPVGGHVSYLTDGFILIQAPGGCYFSRWTTANTPMIIISFLIPEVIVGRLSWTKPMVSLYQLGTNFSNSLYKDTNIFCNESSFVIVVWKCLAFCSGLDVLNALEIL